MNTQIFEVKIDGYTVRDVLIESMLRQYFTSVAMLPEYGTKFDSISVREIFSKEKE